MVLKWTKLAFNDLYEFRFITQKTNPSEYIMKLFEYSKQLKSFPNLGMVYCYARKKIIRRLIFEEHSILYYIDNNTIYIIAVVHHKQDISKKLKSIKSFLDFNL